ncbi:nuclear transport factor 2 family protein [Amycolatopsis sp. NBC_00345]|uniref:nuclear transport factor 2 family protein n=1 Tax=Amycolatopsis sp. NBC_00345 TaxID=2975955 RepID=UPI002E275453
MTHPAADRLADAINRHDLDALTACFAPGYATTFPAHPSRSFTGRDQVRSNWEKLFAAFPDIKATVTGVARTDDGVWAEWEFDGSGPDGARFHQRGVIVMVVEGELIARTRFYMEPVDAPQP